MSHENEQFNLDQRLLQIQNAIMLRTSQDQVLWTMFGIFWAANVLLLVALFNSGSFPDKQVTIVIAVTGLLTAIVWHLFQSRALGNVMKYESLMRRLENTSLIPKDFRTSKAPEAVYSLLLGRKAPCYRRGPQARYLFPWCSLLVASAWVTVAVFSLLT